MEEFKARVIAEKEELDLKIAKLSAFLQTGTFQDLAPNDKRLLTRQEGVMQDYAEILQMRIDRF